MPELPEIAHLRRTLEPGLTGTTVSRVRLLRPDIVRHEAGRTRRARGRVSGRDLLQGRRVTRLARHGKELAIVADSGAVVLVHLGMSGQLWLTPPGRPLERTDHVHCVWQLAGTDGAAGRLVFRDPRRFGGLWAYPSMDALRAARWSHLGPDALTVTTSALGCRLTRTRRAIKPTLLDQRVVAGIGNIYADEILFEARLHPLRPAATLEPPETRRLATTTRRILRHAARSGGSTIRDYVDGRGQAGRYGQQHKVYGRAGGSCPRCGGTLQGRVIGQRSTTFCACCQRRDT